MDLLLSVYVPVAISSVVLVDSFGNAVMIERVEYEVCTVSVLDLIDRVFENDDDDNDDCDCDCQCCYHL